MVRRRNGKRGKGMATKKEKTKEQRIKTEKTRLKGIFKDLDENKRKLVTPLIEKAAFMSIELDDLQAKLEKDGWTSEYQNGRNQWGTKKSPEAETYIALSKNYAAVIKQLRNERQAGWRLCGKSKQYCRLIEIISMSTTQRLQAAKS